MPMYVRVKDKQTGHEFDVPERDPRIGKAFAPVKSDRYPRSRQPRPAKHKVSMRSRGRTDQSVPVTGQDDQAPATAGASDNASQASAGATSRK